MIELTAAQALALADLAHREGTLILHQLAHTQPAHHPEAVYATPHGTNRGYRISRDGQVAEIGETLPAAD
jgi:hypothetical protein